VARRPIALLHAGLVTSVGLSAPATCAAIRAGVTNHGETRFANSDGDWILGARVPLEEPWRGSAKLVQMLKLAVEECLEPFGSADSQTLPLILCVAEKERSGRLDGLDEELLEELQAELGFVFHPELSSVVAYGRVGVSVALSRARELIHEHGIERVLIASTDSLLLAPTILALNADGRLLSADNSNGFIPGEAAGAIMVGRAGGPGAELWCIGLGFAEEPAPISSDEPLRAEGLTQAIKRSLDDAGLEMHQLDFRITDNSGEQYYFKEASLALTRTLRKRKATFDIWHPADCIGETGSAIGVVVLAVALAASRKSYAAGRTILVHTGSDRGQRAAATLWYGEAV